MALEEDAIEHVSSANLQRAARLYLGENRIDALLQPETYPFKLREEITKKISSET